MVGSHPSRGGDAAERFAGIQRCDRSRGVRSGFLRPWLLLPDASLRRKLPNEVSVCAPCRVVEGTQRVKPFPGLPLLSLPRLRAAPPASHAEWTMEMRALRKSQMASR